jgi:hypothetical protein|tara:strand:+ start:1171 stop:3015 length:1845 start_codon:yes stop_codon:yes gene_type:complete
MAKARDIKYLNKDFNSFRSALINYSKTYFPTTYTDFTEASPGMMFMEMASYVGDVLSFYQDNQFQETFIQYANQTNNLFDLAYMFGYKPKVTGVATTMIDFYQRVPSVGMNYDPDFNYALTIAENAQIKSNVSSTTFITEDLIDFTVSSSLDPTEITVYTVDGNNRPTEYLLKKSRNAISANITTTTLEFNTPEEFATRTINATDLIGILDIVDSDGNTWYEVDFLGQEQVFDSIKNTNPNDPNNYQESDSAPFLLQTKQVARRFATRLLDSNTLQIQFGAGKSNDTTEEVVPNSKNVGLGLTFEKDKLTTAYSPLNFIFNDTYGIAPSNTTLTVRYLTGGGTAANVPANSLITLTNKGVVSFSKYSANDAGGDYQAAFNSLAVSNPEAATGGGDGDTTEELRQNTISSYGTQLRNVTLDDYLVRTLSMPSKYGTVAKAYIEKSKVSSESNAVLDLYVLGFDLNKKLVAPSDALKTNIRTYLTQYKMIGDSVRIKEAFPINIAIDFEIIVLPNFNSNEVLRNCILTLQTYFNIDEWQVNEPIILRDVYALLDKVQGIQTVKNIVFTNKTGGSYSNYKYDVVGAMIDNVIYPSIDPMVFEVKYPNSDIKGRIVNL